MAENDIFVRNDLYPNATSVFSDNIRPVNTIKNDCIYVFDTNALLLPYYGSSNNLTSIKGILSYLIKKSRLYIPGQVAREFAANRPDRIKEIFQMLNQQINVIKEFKNFKYPILNEISAYNELVTIEKEFNTFAAATRERYRSVVNNVLREIKQWTWNDPVSAMYQEFFTKEVVVDPEFDREKLKKEMLWRHTHKVPPGYKDQSKSDDGIGDFLIWKTILELGATHKNHLIFVSGEEKADWLYKSEGQILYPRYELVNEYARISEGKSFHILKYSEFLDLMSGAADLVKEIERIEIDILTLEDMKHFGYDFRNMLRENPEERFQKISTGYLVNEELQLIKSLIQLYVNMNADKDFYLQERFIDTITMVHRNGFYNYDSYKRLMYFFTRDNWDEMSDDDLEKIYVELQQLRQLLASKLTFINSSLRGEFLDSIKE